MIEQQPTQEPEKKGLGHKVKEAAKDQVKKKLIKKGIKLAVKALAKVGALALKWLLGLLASVGLPVIAIALGIILLIFIVYIIFMLAFSSGEGVSEKEIALREDLQEISESTAILESHYNLYFDVPTDLLYAMVNLEENYGKKVKYAKKIAEMLKPTPTIITLKEATEREVCGENGCSTYMIPRTVKRWGSVETWDGVTTFEYTPYITEWVSVSPGVSEREHTYTISHNETKDYTKFEEALTEIMDYTQKDILFVELMYSLVGEIEYSEWKGLSSPYGNMYIPNVLAGGSVPSEYMQYYLQAEKKYGVSWFYLAALHYVETKFSTHKPMISSVGAEGHLQFMPCTWVGWSYPGCKGSNGYVKMNDSTKHSPSVINQYGGYGVDGDGNGTASPWEIADAVFTAAKYIKNSGFKADNQQAIDRAIFNYNHSGIYVSKVNAAAMKFKQEASYFGNGETNPGGFVTPAQGRVSSGYGWRTLGGYRDWHQGVDISNKAPQIPIYAVADGVVTKVVSTCSRNTSATCQGTTYGNYIRVKHTVNGQSYETLSAHLAAVNVTVNQSVKQGQVIGIMGNSGHSTGQHLHFEIHKGSWSWPPTNAMNPALLVPLP